MFRPPETGNNQQYSLLTDLDAYVIWFSWTKSAHNVEPDVFIMFMDQTCLANVFISTEYSHQLFSSVIRTNVNELNHN